MKRSGRKEAASGPHSAGDECSDPMEMIMEVPAAMA